MVSKAGSFNSNHNKEALSGTDETYKSFYFLHYGTQFSENYSKILTKLWDTINPLQCHFNTVKNIKETTLFYF